MLSKSSLELIEASQGWRQNRIEMFDLPEGEVVVKGQRPARGPWRFRIMSGLASFTHNPLLKPVPAPGGREAQATEVRRLQALAAAGVQVPEVLHHGDRFIVLRKIAGEPLQQRFVGTPRVALQAFAMGLEGLQDLHRRQQYLSQAFARNILVQGQTLWFIDFEDDPLQAMDLADAQARDLLAFLLSAVWVSRAPRTGLMATWTAASTQSSPEVMARVRRAVAGLAWLRHLPRERKPWGRDVVTVQALAEFMHHWIHSSPASSEGT